MRMKPKKELVRENDRIWSFLVKHKYNSTCQMCGKPATEAHHIISRTEYNTRWDTDNGIALCRECHRKIHDKMGNEEKEAFYRKIIGDDIYELLLRKSKYIGSRDYGTVEGWNRILRSEFLQEFGMTWEEYLQEAKGL